MQDFKPILEKATTENTETITDMQIIMAKLTEGKELNREVVQKAVDFLAKNPDYGFFLMAYNPENRKEEVGTLSVTFAHEFFQNQPVWWYQSVYVDDKMRGKGIFRQMFQNVEDEAAQLKYPLKLYVEVENDRAMAVYKKMGMYDCNEIYLEDDFEFGHDATFKPTENFKFALLDTKDTTQFEKLQQKNSSWKSAFGQETVSNEDLRASFEHLQKQPCHGDVILAQDNQGELIGACGIFYEYSEWRNGVTVYISDFRYDESKIQSDEQFVDFYRGLFHWCKVVHKFNEDLPLYCLRCIINEKLPAVELIKKAGMHEGHYRVYIKDKEAVVAAGGSDNNSP